MATPAGERDRLIAFQRGEAEQAGLGQEPARSWREITRAWAKVTFGAAQERRQAAADGATMTATFRVPSCRATRDVTERDRIRFDGRAWDIASIAPIGVNDEIEFSAVVAKG